MSRFKNMEAYNGQPHMAKSFPDGRGGGRVMGLVLADANYDSGRLFDCVAMHGGRLLTPLPKNAGCGHRPQSPFRLEGARAWESIAGYVYKERSAAERYFAQQSAFGGGLAPLRIKGSNASRLWLGLSETSHVRAR